MHIEAAAPASRPVAQLPTGAQILASQPGAVRQAYAEHQSSGTWPVFRADGSLLVPYGYAHKAVIACAPLHTTDITLEAGETVTDVALGDQRSLASHPGLGG